MDIHPPRFDRIAPALKAFFGAIPEDAARGKLFVVREDGFDEFS